MNSNNSGSNNDVIKDLLSGENSYLTGLLIILANVIGFVTHFKKLNHTPQFTYGLLAIMIVLGSILSYL